MLECNFLVLTQRDNIDDLLLRPGLDHSGKKPGREPVAGDLYYLPGGVSKKSATLKVLSVTWKETCCDVELEFPTQTDMPGLSHRERYQVLLDLGFEPWL